MNCEYVRKSYAVPACIGRKIIFKGRPGIIVEDRGHYIGVTFDSDKPNEILNIHPADNVEYCGMGKPRKMTRSQRRYQEYLKCDWYENFAEFLGIKLKEKSAR